MSGQESSQRRLNYLFYLHRDCIQYLTHLDSLIWQIPTISMAVNAFLASSYINENSNELIRLIIVVFSLIFNVVALIALIKHRLHAEAKTSDLEYIQDEIEKELKNLEIENIRRMRVRTDKILKHKESYNFSKFYCPLSECVLDIKAYNVFKWMLILIICFLLFLTGYQLYPFLYP